MEAKNAVAECKKLREKVGLREFVLSMPDAISMAGAPAPPLPCSRRHAACGRSDGL